MLVDANCVAEADAGLTLEVGHVEVHPHGVARENGGVRHGRDHRDAASVGVDFVIQLTIRRTEVVADGVVCALVVVPQGNVCRLEVVKKTPIIRLLKNCKPCIVREMSHLQKALSIWTQSDHTQAEFSKITGIEQSLCSRIFNGSRGLTISQRRGVIAGFREVNLQQGLIFLKADLEDQTPVDARDFLRLVINLPERTSEAKPSELNRVEIAREKLIEELQANDPAVLSMAVALHDWRTHNL